MSADRRVASLLLLLVLGALLAVPATSVASDTEQEARAIEAMLIAPCCFSQQVSVHMSPAAADVRRDIRARLAAGATRQEILDAYVAQYGKRILAEPPAEGVARALYVVPPLVLVLTAGLVVLFLRRFTSREESRAAAAPLTAVPADPRLRTALDDQLRDLD